MNLDSKDKNHIFLISILFILVLILSVYISFSRQKVHSFYDNMDLNLTAPLDFNFTESDIDENCSFCEDHDLGKYVNEKFKESGLLDFLKSQNSLEKPSVSDLPSFDEFEYDLNSNCTSLFPIEESIKYSRDYKYTMSDDTIFYVSEKYKGKLNEFYVFESISKINFNQGNYLVKMENYFLSNGKCVLSYFSTDVNEKGNQMECSGNYEIFLCEEFINQLNYTGVEKYYTYGKNYDVYVYSSYDNSTILKYGKDIPILFYLKQEEEHNKKLLIELLNVEGVKV